MADEDVPEEEEDSSKESSKDESLDKSPEESPEDDPPEKSPEDESPEESPEDDPPEKSPEDESPEESPEDESPEESPEDDPPEESPGDRDEDLHLTLYGAFNLGWKLQYLRQAGHHQYPVYSEDEDYIIGVLSNVRNILDTIGVSPAVKHDIRTFESRLEEEYVQNIDENTAEDDENSDNELPTLLLGDGNTLSNKVDTWRSVLKYELVEENRFTVANAPVIDLEEILQSPDNLFEDDVWDSLPEQTKEDLTEGCMSLAAHCSTASVIMVLRSIEYLLREWYKQELGEDEADDPWGPGLGKLQSEFNNRGEDPDVLSNLEYLRRKRNEVNHPNRSPSLHEAAVTIAMASETITAMIQSINLEDGLEIEDQV